MGALVAIVLSQDWQPTDLQAFTAGDFIYIAAADLFPEMQKETTWQKSSRQLIGLLIGLTIMLLMKIFLD